MNRCKQNLAPNVLLLYRLMHTISLLVGEDRQFYPVLPSHRCSPVGGLGSRGEETAYHTGN